MSELLWRTPLGWLTPPPPRDGWLGRSASALTKRTCSLLNGSPFSSIVSTGTIRCQLLENQLEEAAQQLEFLHELQSSLGKSAVRVTVIASFVENILFPESNAFHEPSCGNNVHLPFQERSYLSALLAMKRGQDSQKVMDLMQEAVETHFGGLRVSVCFKQHFSNFLMRESSLEEDTKICPQTSTIFSCQHTCRDFGSETQN